MFKNIFKKKKNEAAEKRIEEALKIAWQYGQIGSSFHKMWTIDQMVRALCGDEDKYREWVEAYEIPINYKEDDYYEWNTGIAPTDE